MLLEDKIKLFRQKYCSKHIETLSRWIFKKTSPSKKYVYKIYTAIHFQPNVDNIKYLTFNSIISNINSQEDKLCQISF